MLYQLKYKARNEVLTSYFEAKDEATAQLAGPLYTAAQGWRFISVTPGILFDAGKFLAELGKTEPQDKPLVRPIAAASQPTVAK